MNDQSHASVLEQKSLLLFTTLPKKIVSNEKLNSFSLFLELYKVILVVCFTRKYILVSLNLGIARNLEANDTAFTDYY